GLVATGRPGLHLVEEGRAQHQLRLAVGAQGLAGREPPPAHLAPGPPDNGCHRRAEAVIEGAGQNLGGVVLAGQRLQHDDGICRGSRPRAQQCDAQPDAAPPGLAFDSPDVPHGAILPRAAAAQALSSPVAYPTAPVTRATASWACRLSKCETVTSKRATRGLVETTAATRRAASSQNMRFSALARANACSSSRFT